LIPCVRFLISTPAWGSGLAPYVPRPRRQRVAGWQHKAHARCREASLNIQSCGECRNVAERSKRSGQKNLFAFYLSLQLRHSSFFVQIHNSFESSAPLLCFLQASTWMPCFENSAHTGIQLDACLTCIFIHVRSLDRYLHRIRSSPPDGLGTRQAGRWHFSRSLGA
jgi:hypothetical protein